MSLVRWILICFFPAAPYNKFTLSLDLPILCNTLMFQTNLFVHNCVHSASHVFNAGHLQVSLHHWRVWFRVSPGMQQV